MASAARLEDSEIQNHVDNEAMMNFIQNYPVIYDKRSPVYKIPLRKKNAWKAVAIELGISEDEAKTRNNSIRKNFTKYVKKLRNATRSGVGLNNMPEIKVDYEHLRCLNIERVHLISRLVSETE